MMPSLCQKKGKRTVDGVASDVEHDARYAHMGTMAVSVLVALVVDGSSLCRMGDMMVAER
jgi:hypothetical protein